MNLTMSRKSVVKEEKQKRDVKGFFSKLSRGLMLPISVLPIAGLFLGIGAAIVNGTDSGTFANYLGLFMQNSGDVVFGNLPLLFAISISITFTNDSGAAGLSAFVAWLVFNGAQSALIDKGLYADYTVALSAAEVTHLSNANVDFSGIDGLQEAFTKAVADGTGLEVSIDYNTATSGAMDAIKSNDAFDSVSSSWLAQDSTYKNAEGDDSYKIVILGQGVSFTTSQFTLNQGINSLNTSVFGGLIVGGLIAVVYNKWNEMQLPAIVGFWSGVRFVLTASFVVALPLALVFLLVWPWIGLGLYYIGIGLNKVPYGVDSLLFGIIERSLIPFGLHHVFYTPLWYTQAGGEINTAISLGEIASNAGVTTATVIESMNFTEGEVVNSIEINSNTTLAVAMELSGFTVQAGDELAQGDQNMWFWANEYIGASQSSEIPEGDWLTFAWLEEYLQVDPGQYMQGKYAFMILALPAAAAAMVMAAPKGKDREVAQSVIIAAAFTSFLTGITEPIEFTFLFLAPWLFWGFHAIMAGFSFMFMDIFSANVGMTFSGGLIDLIIYGAVPYSAGVATEFYWAIIIGLVYMPIYYFVFYYAITKFDIATPGRTADAKLYSKADYNERKASKGAESNEERTAEVVGALGGYKNLDNVDACITRLRVKVKDADKVNAAWLKELGAAGVVGEGTKNIQAIFGGEADVLKQKINKNIIAGNTDLSILGDKNPENKIKEVTTETKEVKATETKPKKTTVKKTTVKKTTKK